MSPPGRPEGEHGSAKREGTAVSATTSADLAHLVGALPEVYQPIFGHPEYDAAASRRCDDRLQQARSVVQALATALGRAPRVVDLGCAQGYFSLGLAAVGAVVRGVDISPENIAVCRALAAEHPDLDVHFDTRSLEEVIGGLQAGEVDVVLGLSIFHHVVHQWGAERASALLARIAGVSAVALVELALAAEPVYWAAAQPADERSLLAGFAFLHELGRYPTHLSGTPRPLFFCSNGYWWLGGELEAFSTWKSASHVRAGNVHQHSRRYYESRSLLAKLFLRSEAMDEVNRLEMTREREVLSRFAETLPWLPRLHLHGASAHEMWLVRELIPGRLLAEAIDAGDDYDPRTVIADVLDALCDLERVDLYHADVRVWNVVLTAEGRARLIDFGSIAGERRDCAWPHDLVLAFWLFVREVAQRSVDRVEPCRSPLLGPSNLPEPFVGWARDIWSRPASEWTFAVLRERFDATPGPGGEVHPETAGRWMAAIESHAERMASEAAHLRWRDDDLGLELARLRDQLKVERGVSTPRDSVSPAQAEQPGSALELVRRQAAILGSEAETTRRALASLEGELARARSKEARYVAMEAELERWRDDAVGLRGTLDALREKEAVAAASQRLAEELLRQTQASRDMAERRAAELEDLLKRADITLTAVREATNHDQQQAVDEIASLVRELDGARLRVQELEAGRIASDARARELVDQAHEWWSVADGLNREMRRLRSGFSWHMASPLRGLETAILRLGRRLRSAVKSVAGLARRASRHCLVSTWRFIETRPSYRARLARVLARVPWLDRRLRRLALRQRREPASGRTPSHPISGGEGTAAEAPLHPGNAQYDWPRSMRSAFGDLVRARMRQIGMPRAPSGGGDGDK